MEKEIIFMEIIHIKVSNSGGGGVSIVSKELAGGFIAPSTRYARDGNFWVVVKFKSLVKELKNQSGAKRAL